MQGSLSSQLIRIRSFPSSQPIKIQDSHSFQPIRTHFYFLPANQDAVPIPYIQNTEFCFLPASDNSPLHFSQPIKIQHSFLPANKNPPLPFLSANQNAGFLFLSFLSANQEAVFTLPIMTRGFTSLSQSKHIILIPLSQWQLAPSLLSANQNAVFSFPPANKNPPLYFLSANQNTEFSFLLAN